MIRIATALAMVLLSSVTAFGGDAPGVTATEVKIGGVFPFTGPASSIGVTGKGLIAYVNWINDRGGINGRKINYIALDDAYSPPKAVEHVRRLVESDEVAFMFSQLGTAGISATAKYLTLKGVPNVAVVTGSNRFASAKDFPLTTTALVSFETEGRMYAKYLSGAHPNSKFAVLFQNDDLGKDYASGFRSYFGAEHENKVVSAAYEVTDPTVDSQIVNLKNSGADALFVAGTQKFAAQAIRKVFELGWKPTIILNYPSSSAATLRPAGLEKSIGVIAGTLNKDPSDVSWQNDEGMKTYKSFFAKYLPGADIADGNYATGFDQGAILEQLLKQCGDDLSRENIAKQSKNIKGLVIPTALPGIQVNSTSGSNSMFTHMRLQRWGGASWEPFGEALSSE